MLRVALDAIRARPAQAAVLLVLTALVVATASAAPWYVAASARAVARADVAAAPAEQLVVRATGRTDSGPSARPADPPAAQTASVLRDARDAAARVVQVPGAADTLSLRLSGSFTGGPDGTRVTTNLAFREELCERVTVTGACPHRPGEVVVTGRLADQLGVDVGDPIRYRAGAQVPPRTLRVVGRYDLREPDAPYWVGALGPTGEAGGQPAADPIFTTAETVATLPVRQLVAEYHLVLPATAFLDPGRFDLAAELRRQQQESVGTPWRIETAAGLLADRVLREQRLVDRGVAVAALQLLALGSLALLFAARRTADQRRVDIGLLKLRGQARWRIRALALQQTLLPVLAGVGLGVAGGVALARSLGGGIDDATAARSAAGQSLLAAAVATAVVGLAAAAADRRAVRDDVPALLRRVPARTRGWRAGTVDAVVAALCLAGIYQALVTPPEAAEGAGLLLLAPLLVALLVALLTARLVEPAAGRLGRWALRAGRLPVALAATQIARRSGMHRLLLLVTVAVALLATSASAWQTAAAARAARAEHDVGAGRVLTVLADNRAHLLAAVRAADPSGTAAMAVVRNATGGAGQTVLAVDAERLAAAADIRPGYAFGDVGVLTARLRPAVPEPVLVRDGRLRLLADGIDVADVADIGSGGAGGDQAASLAVVVHLAKPGGGPQRVVFGPLRPGPTGYPAEVTGCGAAGCRLTGLEVAARSVSGELFPPPPRRTVRVAALDGPGGAVLDAATLGAVSRWRPAVGPRILGPVVGVDGARLTLTTPEPAGPQPGERSGRIHLVDTPVPLPVIAANGRPPEQRPGDPRLPLFGGGSAPVRAVGEVGTLPGVVGRGFLVDLEYADRLAEGSGNGDQLQVWLAGDAPPALIERLRAQRLVVLDDRSTAGVRDRYDRQGPAAALRFQLLAGLLGLLLAAVAMAVAGVVERPDRAADLAALRTQGLPAAAVRWAARAGYAVPLVVCVAAGVVAGAFSIALLPGAIPAFVDDWRVLPLPTAPSPGALALAAAAALAVGGAVAGAGAVRLTAAAGAARGSRR